MCWHTGMRAFRRSLAAACAAVFLHSVTASAQLRATVVVSGLTQPVAFVQDPGDSATRYVVEQRGTIRVVRNGAVQPAPFLDLTASIASGGERGLLGLAFAPDYATSGRFYVNFTNTAGDTVVARFKRSAASPLLADPASRFDLRWSTGERVIRQPFANHNGGNLAFGPDGYLYIGMGDGGSGDDPQNNAQNPASLLGKMLRIDVSVPDADPAGFRVPSDNPFRSGPAPEIWDIGLRNPWRWSFDDPTHGGTGALIIGDVGQDEWEEIDYEPRHSGGRNYGWRIREGAHPNVTSLPPAFLPLIDPIFEYSHPTGFSLTGGCVYRGSALPALYRGRYFFADFVTRKVWSIALTVNPSTGAATASDLRDHSEELGAPDVTSFGTDAAGELYVTSYAAGTILRITSTSEPAASGAILTVESPVGGSPVISPFLISGWALDTDAPEGTGIDAIQAWAVPWSGGPARTVGTARLGILRDDVALTFGSQFSRAGFAFFASGLPPDRYTLVVAALLRGTGTWSVIRTVDVTVTASIGNEVHAHAEACMPYRCKD